MKNTTILLMAFACISMLASCSQSSSSTTPSATSPETLVVSSSENQDIVTTPISIETVPPSNTTTPTSQKTTVTPTVTVSKTDTPVPQNNAKTTTKTISYRTPSHQWPTSTAFSVTIEDGIITDASATFLSGDHEDRQYQSRFSRQIASTVVGKKASNLSLDTVGGASLTTEAFTQFVRSL